MATARLEYIGFNALDTKREYTVRLQDASSEPRDFVLVISSEVFRTHRARYQDGPDICYQKMVRELVACEGTGKLPDGIMHVTDAEIDNYRDAHTPKAAARKVRPAPQPSDR